MSNIEVSQDAKVSVFRINRPDKLNALDRQAVSDLRCALEDFERSTQRVAVIAARGEKAFCAGADLSDPPDFWRCVPSLGVTTRKPVIAAVHGWCIGGGLLFPIFADLCVAAEGARFLYPDAKLGLSGGIVAALAARVPHKAAMEMILLGRTVTARRAYEIGLVNEVVADGEQVDAALRMAHELAAMAPLVLSTLKSFVEESVLPKGPAERMIQAQRMLETIGESADRREGMAAHREGRPPDFHGR
ncbi:MAG: enoyl-CoA hydratase/isomerase family protein [Burkholderiales bacterium]|nr:enoyl-CoA hydratase/isomerase family protein [Burkholderiales bacterium]OJX04962.1 MAG: enoyl-CoA hydratase [Burkholderiales bacterium 70-64]